MSSSLLDFAKRLETDIRRRCLTPGHKYLTAEESAKMLGTSVATANRALRLLADQEVVVRRRNSGTFVGPAAQNNASEDVQTVSIVAQADMRLEGVLRFDLIIQGVLTNLRDVADVRVTYVPAENGVPFLRNLLEPDRDAGRLAGVIAVSCPREIYRYFGENNYPLVVMGSLYPDQPYPSVDADERAAGQMLTRYLLDRGHRRLAMFSNSESRPGDNYFRDGVSDALTSAQLPHNALVLRAPGQDPAVLRAQVDELLSMPDRPTGIIVKLPRWADEIAAMIAERGLRVPQDVEIVFKGYALGEAGKSAFPHVRPRLPYRQIAAIVGKMLAAVREKMQLEQRTVVVPYEMCQSPAMGVVD